MNIVSEADSAISFSYFRETDFNIGEMIVVVAAISKSRFNIDRELIEIR